MKFLFVLLVLTSGIQAAAPDKPISESDLAGKLKMYEKIKTLKTNFHQVKHLKELHLDLISEGELEVVRPDRVVWKVIKPAPVRFTMNGSTFSIESGEGKKTEKIEAGKEIDDKMAKSLATMVAWLKMDVPAIWKAYTIAGTDNEFRCIPRDAETALFKAIVIRLHPKGHLEHLTLEEKSGDSIEISFSPPRING